ncbi:MAG TPA: DinB family protein [Chloroflexaceae bacterium]|nr:DinB family protein [Chloroflexaceae bacterium]
MPPERERLVATLAALPARLEALVAGLSAAELTAHYLAGEWSVAQNVHHLVDSHMNSYVRCKLILTEERPTLKPYDQDAWAALPDGAEADIAVSLAILRGLHERWARFWRALPESAWAREGLHPEAGPMSLDDILRSYAAHGEGHLDQIGRTLAAGASTSS